MPRFRSRPREITAEKYSANSAGIRPNGVCLCAKMVMGPHVHTMHEGQQVELQEGDWVVQEPDGVHYYPIKADVMEKNYEQISE